MTDHEFPEGKLIPYEASRFRARRVLVFAPHADDEIFGCGGALADLIEGGAAARVLVLTDGAGDEKNPEERTRIGTLRANESRAALAALGGGDVVTAHLPDRGMESRRREVQETLEAALVGFSPDLVFVPSPAEIHPDHRAVAEALLALASGPAADTFEETTFAFYEVSQPIRPNFLFDATRVAAKKARAVACFTSQLGLRDYRSFVEGLGAYRCMTLPKEVTSAEAFYVLPARALRNGASSLRAAIGPSVVSSPPASVRGNGKPPLSFMRRLRVLFTGELPK